MTDIKRWLTHILEILLLVVALLTVVQVLFGRDATKLFGMDVIQNIGDLASKFGSAGLVGVVAIAVVAWLILQARPFEGGGGGR
jgi:hypothetical protein